MLRLALLFLIVGIIAFFLGFGVIGDLSFLAAKIFFFIFIVLAVIFLIGGVIGGRPRDVV